MKGDLTLHSHYSGGDVAVATDCTAKPTCSVNLIASEPAAP
jgi:hypothetical protein